MATKRQIDLVIKARDESQNVFEKVKENARALNREARMSGEADLEKLVKGAGAIGIFMEAVEGTEKVLDAGREALLAYDNQAVTGTEAWGMFIDKSLNTIPVISSVKSAFDGIARSLEDGTAILLKYAGASDEVVDMFKSEATRKEEFQATVDALEKVRNAYMDMHRAAKEASETGYDAQRSQVEEASRIELEKLNKELAEARSKIPLEKKGDLDAFDTAAAAARVELERKTVAEIFKIDIQQHAELESEQISFEAKMNDIRAQRRVNILHRVGLEGQAEIEAINQQLERELAAMKAGLEKAQAEHPERQSELYDEYREESHALKTNAALEVDRVKREQRVREEDEERQHQQRLNDIRAQAGVLALENAGKTYDAQLLQLQSSLDQQLANIEERYHDRIEKLRQSEDPEAQRQAAELHRQEIQEKAAARQLNNEQLQKLVQDANLKYSDYRRPDLVESQHLTGTGQRTAEDNALSISKQNLDIGKQMLDLQKKIEDYGKIISDWLTQRPTSVPPSLLN